MKVLIGAIVMVLCAATGPLATPAGAQVRPGQPGPRGGPAEPGSQMAGIPPAEIQLMFDGYALMQAQRMLQISDEQFPQFLPRLKALQEARRRAQMQRQRAIQELRRLTQPRAVPVDEAELRDRLKALDDIEARSAGEIRQAMTALDQVLDPLQQARLRIFEETMEQRKVELLMRAREGNRPQNRPPNRPPNEF